MYIKRSIVYINNNSELLFSPELLSVYNYTLQSFCYKIVIPIKWISGTNNKIILSNNKNKPMTTIITKNKPRANNDLNNFSADLAFIYFTSFGGLTRANTTSPL